MHAFVLQACGDRPAGEALGHLKGDVVVLFSCTPIGCHAGVWLHRNQDAGDVLPVSHGRQDVLESSQQVPAIHVRWDEAVRVYAMLPGRVILSGRWPCEQGHLLPLFRRRLSQHGILVGRDGVGLMLWPSMQSRRIIFSCFSTTCRLGR